MAKTAFKVVVETDEPPKVNVLRTLVATALSKEKLLKGRVTVTKPQEGK